jgi:uncharacterized membrane protein YkvA (DUF1232 family)
VSFNHETEESEYESPPPRRGRRSRRGLADDNVRAAPRTGAKRTVMSTIRQLPAYIKLLAGLVTDRRVAVVDKLLVAGALAYILMPIDLIPDFVPFLGQVDDVFLLVTSLQRLVSNAGKQVVLDHWTGDIGELADMNMQRVVGAAAFFLPGQIRRRLKGLARG